MWSGEAAQNPEVSIGPVPNLSRGKNENSLAWHADRRICGIRPCGGRHPACHCTRCFTTGMPESWSAILAFMGCALVHEVVTRRQNEAQTVRRMLTLKKAYDKQKQELEQRLVRNPGLIQALASAPSTCNTLQFSGGYPV